MDIARRIPLLIALAAAGTLPLDGALAAETRISLKDLPAVVDSVFKATYPRAVIRGTAVEVEDSVTYYEIESLDGNTRRDLLYAADGKVFEIEEAVAAKALPAAIRQALANGFPKARMVTAEKTTRPSGVQYDIALKEGRKSIEVALDEQGKILHQQEIKARAESSEGREEREDRD